MFKITKKSELSDICDFGEITNNKDAKMLCEKSVELGKFDIAKYLIEKYPKYKIKEVALARSISKSNFEFVKYLVDKNININWNDGYIIASLAETKSKIVWLKYIIENNKTKPSKETLKEALESAKMVNNIKAEKYLNELFVN